MLEADVITYRGFLVVHAKDKPNSKSGGDDTHVFDPHNKLLNPL